MAKCVIYVAFVLLLGAKRVKFFKVPTGNDDEEGPRTRQKVHAANAAG